MQPGDVPRMYADVSELGKPIGFNPQMTLTQGICKIKLYMLV